MTRRRRRSKGPLRCEKCKAPFRWVLHRGRWWKFDPRPVDPRSEVLTTAAYPIEGHRAWHFPALVDELMGRRECSRAEAEEEARDMPWHQPHVCLPNTPEKEQQQ